jgi:transposase
VVVDCFHIVQLAQPHFAGLRRHFTWKQHGHRARKGDSICTIRKLLRRKNEDLTDEQPSQDRVGRHGHARELLNP